jgi:hypothetical protein
MANLIYVHIGTTLNNAKYLTDSILQTLLINTQCNIYVILSDELISEFQESINSLIDSVAGHTINKNSIEIVPVSILYELLKTYQDFNDYILILNLKFQHLLKFRDAFWATTTLRFFYIKEFVKQRNLTNIFHIENDVTMYIPFDMICSNFKIEDLNIYMTKDSKYRVIPSILYFPGLSATEALCRHITFMLSKSCDFMNDMGILARYPQLAELACAPTLKSDSNNIIFDAACIGQYLGGIDPKNIDQNSAGPSDMVVYNNPLAELFINETADFKPNTCTYKTVYENKLKKYVLTTKDNKEHCIANLHIHCKQLYQFSSIFDMKYNDIITGDRVLDICDFVITTKQIAEFHKSASESARKKYIFIDATGIEWPMTSEKTVKFFVYSHLLDAFVTIIKHFESYYADKHVVVYSHNSDHSFNDSHYEALKTFPSVIIYAQNVNCTFDPKRVHLLPIGLANAMWPHGSIMDLYKIMSSQYKYKKTKKIYVNLGATHGIRNKLLTECTAKDYPISENKPFRDYLEELSQHMFCLCPRGNGIDTHRFWESLYLGTIPVLIADDSTKLFVKYLRELNVPFIEIESLLNSANSLPTHPNYFSEKLYNETLANFDRSIHCLSQMKLSHFV